MARSRQQVLNCRRGSRIARHKSRMAKAQGSTSGTYQGTPPSSLSGSREGGLAHSQGSSNNRLKERRVDPWLAEDNLLPGQEWHTEIRKAIRSTDAFVACLSRASVSKTGYVNREFKEGLEMAYEQPQGRIFLIPVKLEPCEVPDRFVDKQWADYSDPRGFTSLLESLRLLAEWLRQAGAKVSLPG